MPKTNTRLRNASYDFYHTKNYIKFLRRLQIPPFYWPGFILLYQRNISLLSQPLWEDLTASLYREILPSQGPGRIEPLTLISELTSLGGTSRTNRSHMPKTPQLLSPVLLVTVD